MFGKRLEELIAKSKKSKREISRELEISHTQLNRYVKSESEPTSSVIMRIVEIFGVSSDFLLGLSDDPAPAIGESNLKDKELEVITLWRRKDYTQAATIILQDKKD